MHVCCWLGGMWGAFVFIGVELWTLVRASFPSPWRQGRGEPANGGHGTFP